jgi:NAD(P)-dependent dehydrogenase (short-subunit alcohol dehydrogenase family)
MTNPMDMTGKTVLVTGASSGIGRETCRCLGELGARVVMVARDRQRLDKIALELEGTGHSAEPFDLAMSDEIPAWLEGITGRLGPLDGCVHCAGVTDTKLIRDWRAKDADAMMRINLYPCFALAKGLRRRQSHKPGASLVFLASVAGFRGTPGLAVYAATKAAVIGLTRSLARELVSDGIRVNCVAPGMVETEMTQGWRRMMTEEQIAQKMKAHPMGFGRPRDVANAAAFLLADTSRWITGTTLVADGGFSA